MVTACFCVGVVVTGVVVGGLLMSVIFWMCYLADSSKFGAGQVWTMMLVGGVCGAVGGMIAGISFLSYLQEIAKNVPVEQVMEQVIGGMPG